MTKPLLRIALLSFWHVHARDYAKAAQDHPGTELIAIWDEQPIRGKQEAESRGIRFVPDLESIWSDPQIDGVIITSATADHPALMLAAAKAGKHIFTEKVLALTTSDCLSIVEAAQQVQIALVVSLPRLAMPFMQAAQNLIADGILGTLTLVRARLAHGGALPTAESEHGYLPLDFFDAEQAGGGALIDLGCHPMYTVSTLLGMPNSVQAAFGYVTNKQVEDNAVVTLQYDSGAIGIVEAGFVSAASPFTVELNGTMGSAIFSVHDGKLIYRSTLLEPDHIKRWHTYELPAPLPSAISDWVDHIHNGTFAHANVQTALDLTALMEAAYKAQAQQTSIRL